MATQKVSSALTALGRSRRPRCPACAAPLNPWGRCSRRTCPAYIHVPVRDIRERLTTNLVAYTDGTGEVLMTDLTGPGQDKLPFDRRRCRKAGPHRCSGPLGCQVVPENAVEFNRAAAQNLTRVNRVVYQRLQRAGLAPPSPVLCRIWQMQDRGVLHAHLLLAYGTDSQRRASDVYRRTLPSVARRYGFGFSDRKREVWTAQEAARYCSRGVRKTLLDAPKGLQILHVTNALTDVTGCTARSQRHRRREYMQAQLR